MKSCVYHEPNVEGEEENPTPPRKGQRTSKQNPKYTNATIVENFEQNLKYLKSCHIIWSGIKPSKMRLFY